MEKVYRTERDSVGECRVEAEAYYGVHSVRARENFKISGRRMRQEFISSIAYIKCAAAELNAESGALGRDTANAIIEACNEIIDGKYSNQFIVDPIQGGAGTSANMNVNEVVANVASVKLGGRPGGGLVHPNDHVNMCQSTNDVIPTAGKLATLRLLYSMLSELDLLILSLADKGDEFDCILKMGRTQLQDAVPMRLGQSFTAFAELLRRDRARIAEAMVGLRTVNMGATAIGSGINAEGHYFDHIVERLSELTGEELCRPYGLFDATQNTDAFVAISGALKTLATGLLKVSNDLRLMSSGPRTGLGEIKLPPRQNGSSIMPGKINPVIPEAVAEVAFMVIGNDLTVTMAAQAGQLELNAFEPIMLDRLFESITSLENVLCTFRVNCIDGITANEEQCRRYVEESVGIVTALNPYIGYVRSAEIAKEALASGRTVRELVLERGLFDEATLDVILDVHELTEPHHE